MVLSIDRTAEGYTAPTSTEYSAGAGNKTPAGYTCNIETYTDEAAALCQEREDRINAEIEEWNAQVDAEIKASCANGLAVELQIGGTTTSVSDSGETIGTSASSGTVTSTSTKPTFSDLEYWMVDSYANSQATKSTLNDDDIVTIDGVDFTGAQMKSFLEFYTKLKAFLPSTYHLDLDYRDYAKLGIGTSLGKAFASSGDWTQEQQDVINKVVEYYEDMITETHDRKVASYGGTTMGSNTYYCTYVSEEKFCEANHQTPNANVEYGLLANNASNMTLANKIRDLYSNVDVTDSDALNALWEQYVNYVKPAYMEQCGSFWEKWGISDDRLYFATMISDAKSLLNSLVTSSVDTTV